MIIAIYEPVWNPILRKFIIEIIEKEKPEKRKPYFFKDKEDANAFVKSLIDDGCQIKD